MSTNIPHKRHRTIGLWLAMTSSIVTSTGCGLEDPDQDRYLEWFASYNDGQGTEYLNQRGTIYPKGDTERYPDAVPHTFIENVAYGPFSRNVMDVYIPTGATDRTPLVIYFHGGGFSSGEKEKLHLGKADVEKYLADGIAVATANYRYGSNSDANAIDAPIPNGICDGSDKGCRKDYIFRDGARAVQFLKYASDSYNIDPENIGIWGSSAGGQIALWIATTPDLAVDNHQDPVLQESTRVQAVGHLCSQVSGNNMAWREHLEFSDAFWTYIGWEDQSIDQGLQRTFDELRDTEEGQALVSIVDYFNALDNDDPAFMAACDTKNYDEDTLLAPENADDAYGWFVHHPKHSTPLYEQCLLVHDECQIATKIMHEGAQADPEQRAAENIQSFMTARLDTSL